MDRQADRVMDKIMEMEPKSVPQPLGVKMEAEELEARAYQRNRSRGRAHPDDDLMQQEKGENSELSEAAGNYVDEQQRRHYYHPSDPPFDHGNPGGRRDDLGQMSLDQSKERDPTILAPQ